MTSCILCESVIDIAKRLFRKGNHEYADPMAIGGLYLVQLDEIFCLGIPWWVIHLPNRLFCFYH